MAFPDSSLAKYREANRRSGWVRGLRAAMQAHDPNGILRRVGRRANSKEDHAGAAAVGAPAAELEGRRRRGRFGLVVRRTFFRPLGWSRHGAPCAWGTPGGTPMEAYRSVGWLKDEGAQSCAPEMMNRKSSSPQTRSQKKACRFGAGPRVETLTNRPLRDGPWFAGCRRTPVGDGPRGSDGFGCPARVPHCWTQQGTRQLTTARLADASSLLGN